VAGSAEHGRRQAASSRTAFLEQQLVIIVDSVDGRRHEMPRLRDIQGAAATSREPDHGPFVTSD